jgi:hypothetical protein
MIYALYGQPGAGKTTLGKLLANHLNSPFILDSDELRKILCKTGVSDLVENTTKGNAIATYLNHLQASRLLNHQQASHVVMCFVNPYEYLRDELNKSNCDPWALRGLSGYDCRWPPEERKQVATCPHCGQPEAGYSPYPHNLDGVVWVLLKSERTLRKELHIKDFEDGTPNHVINTDRSIQESWGELKEVLAL